MSKLAKALTAAAGNAGGESLYVEDVFSTYLYTGNLTARDITNGIDLNGEGGMVYLGGRGNIGSFFKGAVYDTERGATKFIRTNTTNAEATDTSQLTSFNSNGFSLGNDSSAWYTNYPNENEVSWTFRKAEKFFDVVTYSGNNTLGRTVAHNLGSVPAFIIVKCTSNSTTKWTIYHSSLGATKFLEFDTGAAGTAVGFWNNTEPTDSVFTLGNDGAVNATGRDYVAYLFASDAGGFGDDGSESIIKCGSFVPASTWQSVIDIGFEPQWILYKKTTSTGDWYIHDNMRGINTGSADPVLFANSSDAEVDYIDSFSLHANGFEQTFSSVDTNTYIYIAIRRPMKTPESGTEVFSPVAFTGDGVSGRVIDAGFSVDASFGLSRSTTFDNSVLDRIRGNDQFLYTQSNIAESTKARWAFDEQDGIRATTIGADGNNSGDSRIHYFLKRATGFFDVVAYSGNMVENRQVAHNLGVKPDLFIVKRRNGVKDGYVYNSVSGATKFLRFFSSFGDYSTQTSAIPWNNVEPTSSYFSLNDDDAVNGTGDTYVAYLFATLAGVSKVGSYTGTGSNVDVDCGFSAGARFVLIKRLDQLGEFAAPNGDWYVYDSERGIVAGNDPYLLFSTDAVEVTSTDYIDPLSSGFTVTSSAPAALNASGGTYLFLAIA